MEKVSKKKSFKKALKKAPGIANPTQTVTKQDLIDHIAAEYNALLGKLNIYTGLALSPEMIRAKSRLEESFLWVRCSLEKMKAPEKE